jgi:predicted Zn-dependent protease
MNKILWQGFLTVAMFFVLWGVFYQIDWMKLFEVEKLGDTTEEKLGDLMWKYFLQEEKMVKGDAEAVVDSILTSVCKANEIDRNLIKLHVAEKSDVNAFALPDGHIMVYSGLIRTCNSPEELAGVLSHELAHITNHHVMKKLVKEVGLAVLISMTTGGNAGEVIAETARTLSSTAFDRTLEREADLAAVDYLAKADINPEPFADFLFSLALGEHKATKYFTWMSTHPDTKERAEAIVSYAKGKVTNPKSPVSKGLWDRAKAQLE